MTLNCINQLTALLFFKNNIITAPNKALILAKVNAVLAPLPSSHNIPVI